MNPIRPLSGLIGAAVIGGGILAPLATWYFQWMTGTVTSYPDHEFITTLTDVDRWHVACGICIGLFGVACLIVQREEKIHFGSVPIGSLSATTVAYSTLSSTQKTAFKAAATRVVTLGYGMFSLAAWISLVALTVTYATIPDAPPIESKVIYGITCFIVGRIVGCVTSRIIVTTSNLLFPPKDMLDLLRK